MPALQPIVLLLMVPVIIYTELKEGKIYNWLTLPALALGLFLALLEGHLEHSFWAAVLGGGVFMLPYLLTGWSRGKPSVGGGDVKLAAAIGALMGVESTIRILYFAFMIGGLIGLGYIVWRSVQSRRRAPQQDQADAGQKPQAGVLGLMTQRIPFGTSLCMGIMIVLMQQLNTGR